MGLGNLPPSQSVRGRERAKRCERGMQGRCGDGKQESITLTPLHFAKGTAPLLPLDAKGGIQGGLDVLRV